MPFLTPKKSGVHRIACFALYRALLQQSSRVTGVRLPFVRPSPISREAQRTEKQDDAYTIFDTLQRQFRASTRLQGRQIVSAFQIGYEALHSLRSTTSPLDQSALARLARDLKVLYPRAASSPALNPAGPAKAGPRVWRHPSTSSTRPHILQRPLPREMLSGKRHVPRLAITSGITFLRVKKPQPAYLSRMIRDKRQRQQKRADVAEKLERRWKPLAEAEDAWDARIQHLFHSDSELPSSGLLSSVLAQNSSDADSSEGSYAETVRNAIETLSHERYVERVRDRRWGERLLAILLKERQLKFEEEGIMHPLRGTSPERRRIMARQRHERRLRIKERQAQDAKRAKERAERKAQRRLQELAPFVVRLEESDEPSTTSKEAKAAS